MVATTTRGRIRHVAGTITLNAFVETGKVIGADNAHALGTLLLEADADGVLRLTREQIARALGVPYGTGCDRLYALRQCGAMTADANTGRGVHHRFNTALPLVREWLVGQPQHSDDRFTFHRERFSTPEGDGTFNHQGLEGSGPAARQHSYSAGARSPSPARATKQHQQGQAGVGDFENREAGAGAEPTSDSALTLEHVRDPERHNIAKALRDACGVWECTSALLAMQHPPEWIVRCIGNWKQQGGVANWRAVKYGNGPVVLIRRIEDKAARARWDKENERAWTVKAAWQAAGDDRQREADQAERDRLRRVECQRIIAAMSDADLNEKCDRVLQAVLLPDHRAQLDRANRRGMLWMLELISELVPVAPEAEAQVQS